MIGPKILGDSTGLSGFWVIFSITLFGGLYGVPGMLVGVPFCAIVYAGVRMLVHNRLENKNLSPEELEAQKKMENIFKSVAENASPVHEPVHETAQDEE